LSTRPASPCELAGSLIVSARRGAERLRILPSAACLRLFAIVGLTEQLLLVADGNATGTEHPRLPGDPNGQQQQPDA
jgi:hypothetical protein